MVVCLRSHNLHNLSNLRRGENAGIRDPGPGIQSDYIGDKESRYNVYIFRIILKKSMLI